MYNLTVKFSAKVDVREAYDWYSERNASLGDEFLNYVDAAIKKLNENPMLYPVVYKSVRRLLLKKFPFAVYYSVSHSEITIHACLHTRRNPSLWKGRT